MIIISNSYLTLTANISYKIKLKIKKIIQKKPKSMYITVHKEFYSALFKGYPQILTVPSSAQLAHS